MPFRTALSGLNAASQGLRVLGNNIANASTTGFKKSRAEFVDIFATSSLGTTANAIGSGVRVGSIAQQFTQGNIGFTDNNLDLAISGQGFFVLDDNGVAIYSRNGTFGVDRDGYVVNASNQRLTAFQADNVGNITGALGSLQLDTSDIAPQATSTIEAAINLDASETAAAAPVSSSIISLAGTQLDETAGTLTTPNFTLIDNYGNQITNAQLQFTFTGTTPQWNIELLVGGAPTAPASVANNVVIGTDAVTLNWDPDGLAGAQSSLPITIDTLGIISVAGGANDVTATANGAVQGTFVATDADTYNKSTSLTVYDSLGTAHLGTLYFRKTGIPNQWETWTYMDGVQVDGPRVLDFSTLGRLSAIDGTLVPPNSFNVSYSPSGAQPQTIAVDYGALSQYGSPFSVNALRQDGFATGRLSGVDIADSGIITARFTNGQSRTLGQVALANFSNNQGLRQLGDSSWAETFESGAALIGSPGSGSLGLIQSGALEGSNVDLTEQLVGMITAQRDFQANAQVIKTADTVTQTIINIR